MASEVHNDSLKEAPHLHKTPSAKNKTKPHPLDVSVIQATPMDKNKDRGPVTPKTNKIGHRRVDEAGETTYKKTPSSALMKAIQLGIGHSVGRLSSKPERDVLMQDFTVVESVWFPSEGSGQTPAHQYSDFRFKAYAPVAFRFFRELFEIRPADFLMSLSNEPLVELSNPGASGSVFYVSNDDEFIIKTVQHKEAEFLIKLLPGYYLNLSQNKRTLLPKFFGLYCYQCGGKNIRLVVMNNLLPRGYKMHIKYDLKGSTYKRRASKAERAKETPTLKDLDFRNDHPEGILLEPATYNQVILTIQRDCRVLESFKIMDYSLLVGIHNLDEILRERQESAGKAVSNTYEPSAVQPMATVTDMTGKSPEGPEPPTGLIRKHSAKAREGFGAAMEAIQLRGVEDDEDRPPGGIPSRNGKGERLLLFVGVIDILQNYRFKKKLEHGWKSLVHDGDTVSVHRPSFYSSRFNDFMSNTVFKKMPSKGSPNKRKLIGALARSRSVTDADKSRRSSDAKSISRTEPLDRYRSHSISEGDRTRPPARLNLNALSGTADGSFTERSPDLKVTLATEEEMSSPGTPTAVIRRGSAPSHTAGLEKKDIHRDASTTEKSSNTTRNEVEGGVSKQQDRDASQDFRVGDELTDKPLEEIDINSIQLSIVSLANGTSKTVDDVISQNNVTELTSL